MSQKYDMYKWLRTISGEPQPTMGGIPVPYIPSSIDCWTNPLDEYKHTREKAAALRKACDNNEYAVDSDGNKRLVKDLYHHDLEKFAFVAGLWRIQDDFPYEITRVRGKDMVLTEKINHQEKTLFEFYRGKLLNYNCYGPFVINDNQHDYIVAKYVTDKETYWAYGETIEQARAFMGIKMYDEYKDVINVIACKKKLRGK